MDNKPSLSQYFGETEVPPASQFFDEIVTSPSDMIQSVYLGESEVNPTSASELFPTNMTASFTQHKVEEELKFASVVPTVSAATALPATSLPDPSTFFDTIGPEPQMSVSGIATPSILTEAMDGLSVKDQPVDKEGDRRRDAWIPSEEAKKVLLKAQSSPKGAFFPEREALTMPGIILEEELPDGLHEVCVKYLGVGAAGRAAPRADHVSRDTGGLRELLRAGCLRAAINLTNKLLTAHGQGPGRAGRAGAKHSPRSLQLWLTRLCVLVRVRRGAVAAQEAAAFGACDAPDLYYQFYPEQYGDRPGSMVPFALRLLVAELPAHGGQPERALERLYAVLGVVQQVTEQHGHRPGSMVPFALRLLVAELPAHGGQPERALERLYAVLGVVQQVTEQHGHRPGSMVPFALRLLVAELPAHGGQPERALERLYAVLGVVQQVTEQHGHRPGSMVPFALRLLVAELPAHGGQPERALERLYAVLGVVQQVTEQHGHRPGSMVPFALRLLVAELPAHGGQPERALERLYAVLGVVQQVTEQHGHRPGSMVPFALRLLVAELPAHGGQPERALERLYAVLGVVQQVTEQHGHRPGSMVPFALRLLVAELPAHGGQPERALERLYAVLGVVQQVTEQHGHRPGSMVPFALRLLVAELPAHGGQPERALERLYAVLGVVQQMLQNLEEGKTEDGTGVITSEQDKAESIRLWSGRETRVQHSLVNCAIALKDYRLASSIVQSLQERASSEAQARALASAQGRLWLLAGHVRAARCHFDVACTLRHQLCPTPDVREYVDLGLLDVARGNYQDAYNNFARAADQEPTNIMVANNLSVCLLYMGRLKDAIAALQRAVAAAPERGLQPQLLLNLCTLYELQSSKNADKKLNLLRMMCKYKSDTIPNVAECLKLS